MHTWAMFSGGPGSGVYVSRDGGDTWSRISDPGLPHAPVGKIDVAVAPSDSRRVYALIQTADQGSVWRSDDGGRTWGVVSWDRTLIGRAGYYIRIEVNPADADEVLVANSSFHRSTDGGRTFPITDRGCGDCHDIWMDPTDPDRWGVTGDGGAAFTRDHGETFDRFALPIGQMYHVAVDDRVPYWVYSNRQDDGTMRGPERQSRCRWTTSPPTRRRAAGGGSVPSTPWQGGLGGLRVRLHASPARRRGHRVGVVLREHGDPLRRPRRRGALGVTVDSHAGLAAHRHEISLSLDAAPGHRPLRSRDRLLRVPGRVQDLRPGAELGGDQPRPVHAGLVAHRVLGRDHRRQPGPVLRRGGVRHRAERDPAWADLGGDERREDLVHDRRGRRLDGRHGERRGDACVGDRAQDRAVAV